MPPRAPRLVDGKGSAGVRRRVHQRHLVRGFHPLPSQHRPRNGAAVRHPAGMLFPYHLCCVATTAAGQPHALLRKAARPHGVLDTPVMCQMAAFVQNEPRSMARTACSATS